MNKAAASLRGVNHRWHSSGVTACSDVSLDLYSGSLHALVGENGAGKTTLGLILAGVLKPDSGILKLSSGEVNLLKKSKGLTQNTALIRQRNIWPEVLSIREAAVLGRTTRPGRIKEQLSLFNQTAEDWGLAGINPETRVSLMDAASLQRAEMIAALMFNPEVLILDEPSSAWEEGRGSEFFQLMERLKDDGRALLLITHRLEDVFSIADRVTVMRHGSVISCRDVADTDYSTITQEMFGEQPVNPSLSGNTQSGNIQNPDSPITGIAGKPRLEALGLSVKDSGRNALENINFQLFPGEILGITGLREEGLSLLEDVISGNSRVDKGALVLDSKPVPSSASGLRKAGLHYVPSDKTGRGASLQSTVTENMMVLETQNLSKRGWFHQGKIKKWVEERRVEGGISGGPEQKLEELSGGNIQKVILQRELRGNAPLLVVADPAWGLDERSRRQIHVKIRKLSNSGTAILLLASDLDEALELSDRMAVLSSGRLSEIKPAVSWDRNRAAELIAGMKAGGGLE